MGTHDRSRFSSAAAAFLRSSGDRFASCAGRSNGRGRGRGWHTVYCRCIYQRGDIAPAKIGDRIDLTDDGDSGRNEWRHLIFIARMDAVGSGDAVSVSVRESPEGDGRGPLLFDGF